MKQLFILFKTTSGCFANKNPYSQLTFIDKNTSKSGLEITWLTEKPHLKYFYR